MEDVIHTRHHAPARLQIAHIADIELNFVSHLRISHLILVAHIVLLLLVARENAYFPDVACQKTAQHRIPERPGTPRNQKGLILEN